MAKTGLVRCLKADENIQLGIVKQCNKVLKAEYAAYVVMLTAFSHHIVACSALCQECVLTQRPICTHVCV